MLRAEERERSERRKKKGGKREVEKRSRVMKGRRGGVREEVKGRKHTDGETRRKEGDKKQETKGE